MVKRKNRLTTDAVREVRNTFSRFLSILVLSALAVAFLSGLRATAPDMKYTADNYYDRTHMMDGYAVSTLGITDEDLAALAGADGVEAVEGARTVDATATDCIVSIRSLPERLNLLEITQGRLPQAADECVTDEMLLVELGLEVGDTLTLTMEEDDEDTLTRTSYTVVGTFISPLYIGTDLGTTSLGDGSLDGIVYVSGENFTTDYYSIAYFTGVGLEQLDSYGDDYEDAMESLIDSLEPLGDQRAQLRYDALVGDAQEELDSAQAELDDARAEAETELSDAQSELDDARTELDDGWQAYYDGRQELADTVADARREIADGEAELADALVELEDGERELADARNELDDGWQAYYDGLAEYEDGLAEYEDGRQTYEDALAEYEGGRRQYEEGLAEYQDGRKEYQSGVAEINAGWREYNSGAAELDRQIASTAASYTQSTIEDMAAGTAAEQAANALAGTELTPGTPEYEAAYAAAYAQAYDMAYAAFNAQYDTIYNGVYQEVLNSAEVRAARAQLDSAASELQSGERQLDRAWEELEAAEAELDDALAELEAGQAELDDAKAELDAGWAELEDAKTELDDALAELEQGEADYEEGLAELEQGRIDYENGLAELEDARATLEREQRDAQQELDDALADLEQGEADYAEGLVDYEEGRAEADREIADAQDELDDARKQIDEIEECEWYILGRNTNSGFVGYSQDAERVGNLASVFPIIFFLVAALACLTTMTRMVEEQRTQIGALKALGFSRLSISKKYLGYAFFASLSGGLIGLAVGCTLIPLVVANAFHIMYHIPGLDFKSQPALYITAVAAAVLCTTGAALWACISTLVDTPANLMRPKAPKAGRRVFLERIRPLWRHLSFTWKVTMRNLFRYQKRFWMTVIGIGGCTALIVTGFGLHDSIFSILDKQFDEVSVYDATVGLDSHITQAEKEDVRLYLDGDAHVDRWLACRQLTVDASNEDLSYSAYIFAVEDQQAFRELIDLRERKGGRAVEITDDGVVITEKLSEMLDLQVGDTITLEGDRRAEATVTAIAENYVYHYVYMTESFYETLFREPAEENVVLLAYGDEVDPAGQDATSVALMKLDGVSSYSYIGTIRDTFTDSMSAIDYAVVIIIVAAAALAFVVLYNLTNINITERVRELATLKVLGFYDRETTAYIYRENIFLTVFGILLGLVMGRFLHAWLVLTVEVDLVMFGRTAPAYAYLLAAAFTVLFSVIVNIAAHYRLKKVDMVESLKTVE